MWREGRGLAVVDVGGGLQSACTSVPRSLFPVKRGRIIDSAGRTRTEPPRLSSNLLFIADYLIITQTGPSPSLPLAGRPQHCRILHPQSINVTAPRRPTRAYINTTWGLPPSLRRANEGAAVGPQGKGQDMTGLGRHVTCHHGVPASRRPRGRDPPYRLPGLPLCPTGRSGRGRRGRDGR